MPERFDMLVASRLVEDVTSLLDELEVGDGADPETLTRRLLAEEVLKTRSAEDEERLAQAIDAKETFYREVAALWGTMKTAFDQRNMALIRGSHSGLRALALNELEGGDAD